MMSYFSLEEMTMELTREQALTLLKKMIKQAESQ